MVASPAVEKFLKKTTLSFRMKAWAAVASALKFTTPSEEIVESAAVDPLKLTTP